MDTVEQRLVADLTDAVDGEFAALEAGVGALPGHHDRQAVTPSRRHHLTPSCSAIATAFMPATMPTC